MCAHPGTLLGTCRQARTQSRPCPLHALQSDIEAKAKGLPVTACRGHARLKHLRGHGIPAKGLLSRARQSPSELQRYQRLLH